jgi:hypothetical protein
MLQSIALDRWSQVTIYAKPARCSIDLPHEGAKAACQTPESLQASGVYADDLDRCLNRIYEVEERFYESGCSWLMINLISMSISAGAKIDRITPRKRREAAG